jgi:hypothetical protein
LEQRRVALALNWSTRAAVSRAAFVFLDAFSRREIVDCEASGFPLSGQRSMASFVSGSCLSRLRSFVATGNGKGASRDELEHVVPDPSLIAVTRHCVRDSLAHAELALGRAQQQEPGV